MRAANVGDMQPVIGLRVKTGEYDTHDGLKSAEQMQAEHAAWRDQQPTTARCGRCDWTFESTAAAAREAFAAHLAHAHPEIRTKRARTKKTDRDAAMVVVAQRATASTATERREETPVESDRVERADQALEQATSTHGNCKIDGCTEPAAASKGPYAKLCLGHRAEAVARRGQVKSPRTRAATTTKPPPHQKRQPQRALEAACPARPDSQVRADRDAEGRARGAGTGVRCAGRRVREGAALT